MANSRLTSSDVACWLLKSASDVPELRCAGQEVRLSRCVRPTYRLGLVRPGQRVLLWRSGRDGGVRAVGEVAGAPAGGAVEVLLRLLRAPVPRADLIADARFRGGEVVRAPVGSNPSYLTAEQLEAVTERLAPEDAGPWRGPAPGSRTAGPLGGPAAR